MRAQQIVDYVFQIAPNPAFGSENIYEFGNGDQEVTGIAVAWWITSEMLERMAAEGLQLGLSHESVIYPTRDEFKWGAVTAFEDVRANQKIISLTKQHDIAIHRFHSNIDVADWGMPVAVVEQLGWADYEQDWSRGVPVITIPTTTLGELLEHVKTHMRVPFLRYDGNPSREVSRVAIPWGGLCQHWMGALAPDSLGYDVLIGGDIIDGVVRLCREHDVAVIDAMHHATELKAMELLAEKVQAKFPDLRVQYIESDSPWSVHV